MLCASQNNGLWLFDEVDFELLWLNDQAEVGKRSGNIVQQLGYEIDPNFMLERHNWLYLNDPERGILVFDIFGTYLKTIPIKGLSSFSVTTKYLYYQDDTGMYAYDLKLLDVQEVPLPAAKINSYRLVGSTIFSITDESITVFEHTAK